jgi:hypothetical protein
LIGSAFLLVVLAAGVLLTRRIRRLESRSGTAEVNVVQASPSDSVLAVSDTPQELELEILSLEKFEFSTSEIQEISDPGVVARLDSLLVPIVQMAANALTPSLKDAYRVMLPQAAELVKSREIKGAFRAFFRDGRRIAGHANLQKIDPGKAAALTNVAANAMNVAALVVGQHYMAEISSKLDSLNEGVNAISDRLDAELKSKVQSELVLVSEISRFRAEIMENPDERNRKLISLESHKATVAQVLSQVNIEIGLETKESETKRGSKGVKAYQKKVHRLQSLVQQQDILVGTLKEISNLSYVIGSGEISLEASSSVFKGYLEASTGLRSHLGEWHSKQLEALKIDLEAERAEKGAFEAIPGLIVERWKYVSTESGLDREILEQSRLELKSSSQAPDAFDKDVEVIMKDGKYYFLPGTAPLDEISN